jgi:carbonic anhydrase
MSNSYQKLLNGNKKWRTKKANEDPDFFKNLAAGQQPEFLWIGCSDSRVHANEITGVDAGSIFVHRNVANMVVQNDINLLAVLYYAVEFLEIKHVIVCGHHGCGGVTAAYNNTDAGLVNHWIQPIKDVQKKYSSDLQTIDNEQDRINKLVEFNTIEQVHNLSKIGFVQDAWKNQQLNLHGWVFDLTDGKIHDLGCSLSGMSDVRNINSWQ